MSEMVTEFLNVEVGKGIVHRNRFVFGSEKCQSQSIQQNYEYFRLC